MGLGAKFLQRACACVILCGASVAGLSACVKLPRRAGSGRVETSHLTPDAASRPRVSLNRASREELERLPGVGPALAGRVVEHRERFGPFRRAEHLLMVRGISERRFEELRPHVTAE